MEALNTILRVLAVALLLGSGWAFAQSDAAEHQVKAAFLYKFGGYIEWPQGVFSRADSPIAIGVIGADELADELAQITAGRTVNGRPIAVKKLRRGNPLGSLQVLFVGRGESGKMAELLAGTRGQPTLIVTESEEILPQGSMINFVVVGDKVRFDVAPSSAEQGHLKISSRLLAVARRVIAGPT